MRPLEALIAAGKCESYTHNYYIVATRLSGDEYFYYHRCILIYRPRWLGTWHTIEGVEMPLTHVSMHHDLQCMFTFKQVGLEDL